MMTDEVNRRKTFEYWELDTMVSSRGESKGCFATFVERKSLSILPLKSQKEVPTPCNQHLYIPVGAFKTGITDRGKEFACYAKVPPNLDCRFILRMLILLGKGGAMKTQTVCYVNFTRRKQTWRK